MPLSLNLLSSAIGAQVLDLDLGRELDRQTNADIRNSWLEHLILLFRDQHLSQQDLLRFSSYFGELGEMGRPKRFRTSGQKDLPPNIMLISNIRENGEPIGALPDGELMIHHDMIHHPIPHCASLLYAVEVPSRGGDTIFANGYAASAF